MVEALTRIAATRGLSATIKVDNCSEFAAEALDHWAYEHGIELNCNRPDTRTNKAKVENLDVRFWQECLKAHWFLSLADAQNKIGSQHAYYNSIRPHFESQWMTPVEFVCDAREIASPDNVLQGPQFRPGLVLVQGQRVISRQCDSIRLNRWSLRYSRYNRGA